ncbi:hypothetical protein FNB15_18250 [Ferrovibrio terrae]|uniref:Uncharacterized protein n=1 Tax=Ferrovibrio terrae TaxID=2594003 RepID=A0A516H5V9_9PROT|nr:hypothetical protein [Ferrovibrio terrae]QDO99091.1 hypothetical protein FNB15_18250 [Ferrovibrio terrae]
MKGGRKPLHSAEKKARGTLRPCREPAPVGFIDQQGLPAKPAWLTAAGEDVWIDEVGRVSLNRLADRRDTTSFGNFCNLQGCINLCWQSGEVPPAAHLAEARRMAEQFGLFGARSRQNLPAAPKEENPFLAYRQRPAERTAE